MSVNKIVSPAKQLTMTGAITIIVSFATAYVMTTNFSDKSGTELTQAFVTIFGLALSYLSVIIGAYSLIGKSNYKRRLKELYKLDESQVALKNLSEFNANTEEEIKSSIENFNRAQKAIYQELKYYLAFDKTAKYHVFLSIALVALGGACQVYGAL